MSAKRLWIMDGHNMIFAIPSLHRLQVSQRREEARAALAEALERFSIARGEKVLVVFDGGQPAGQPGAYEGPLFETVYTRRGEGVADDRILREARAGFERGLTITVVTNDVATLARHLPRGVRHLGVEPFWLAHVDRRPGGRRGDEEEKRVAGDFSDLEREMLAQAALEERAVRPAASKATAGATPRRERPDPLASKRERGRLRQERRLKRYSARRPGR